MEIGRIPASDSSRSAGLFSHRAVFASDNSQHIQLPPPLAREKIVKRVVGCRRRLLIFGCSYGHNVMDSQLLEINLFGACSVRESAAEGFEITGAKHKALLVLLATAPFGRRTRAFLQETLWGVACYDTGRQSLRRALADIKSIMGGSFGELVTSTNSDVTLDLSRVTFVGRPGQGVFLEGLDIRESGFGQWLAGIRQNPRQLDGLFSLASCSGGASVLPTIAVLPFRAIADDIADATISDWLAEEICRSLSRSRLLSVISHLSCRELARTSIDIPQVRSTLRADFCVAGSLRRSAGRILLDADFIDVRSGRILWTRQIGSPVEGFFQAVEEGIAAIVAAIGAAIADEALNHVASRRLTDVEDHRLVIAGVRLMNRSTLHDLARARELLEEAVRRAPYVAETHAWLGKWYFLSVFNGWSTDTVAETQRGIDSTARALDLSPDNAFCLTIDGLAHNNLLKRLDVAEHRYKTALAINPNEALSLLLRGALHAFRDEGQEAVRCVDRARRLSPIDPFRYFYESLSATAYLSAGAYESALELAESSLLLNDRHVSTLRAKIVALHNLDRGEELRLAGRQLRRHMPDFKIDDYLRSHPASDSKFGRKAVAAFTAAGLS
jgi:TolB-like protein